MLRIFAALLCSFALACSDVKPAAAYDSLMTIDATGWLRIDGEAFSLAEGMPRDAMRRIEELAKRTLGPVERAGDEVEMLSRARVRVEVDPRAPLWAVGRVNGFFGSPGVLISDAVFATSDGSLSDFRPRGPRTDAVSCILFRRDGPASVRFWLSDECNLCDPPHSASSGSGWCVYEAPADAEAARLHGLGWSALLETLRERRPRGGCIDVRGVLDPQTPWSEVRPLAARVDALAPDVLELWVGP